MKKICLFILVVFSLCVFSKDNIIITGNTRAGIFEKDKSFGVASLFAYLSKLPENDNYFYYDCGNLLETNKYTALDNAKNLFNIFNILDLKAVAIGNHELDFGLDSLKENHGSIKLLSCNTDIGIPYVIEEISGKKIGFIGMTRSDIKNVINSDYANEFKVWDSNKTLSDAVKKIREKVDFVVVLSNFYYKSVKNIFTNIQGIDYVFSLYGKNMKDMDIREIEFTTGARMFLIPDGFEYIYTGEIKDERIVFNLTRLPKPHEQINRLYEENFKYKPEYIVKNQNSFINNLLSKLRKDTNTDIVFVNKGSFKIEESDLLDLIRYDGKLHIVSLTGKEIRYFVNTDYYVYGKEYGNKIFGMNIQDDQKYRVLMNDFTFGHSRSLKLYPKIIESDRIESIKKYAIDNFKALEKKEYFSKKYVQNYQNLGINYSKNKNYGAFPSYSAVPKVSDPAVREFKLRYYDNSKLRLRSKEISNYLELKYEKLDGVTNVKNLKCYTTFNFFDKNVVLYQKVDVSFLDNSVGDKPLNHRFSVGQNLNPKLYAGLSYQQYFPKNGRDENIGLQLTYKEKNKLNDNINHSLYSDIFYSNNNDEYYEFEFNNVITIPLKRGLSFEIAKDYFLVYDKAVGKRAYNSDIFFGLNISKSNKRFK